MTCKTNWADLKIKLLSTHSTSVIPLLLKIRLELGILVLDKCLGDIRETDESDYGADIAKP